MKTTGFFILQIIAAFLFVSCSQSDSKYEGTWVSFINNDHQKKITIRKVDNSFIMEGDYNGILIKNKQGNLTDNKYQDIVYDGKSDVLIYSISVLGQGVTRTFTREESKSKNK